uniref:CCHC-type domain-containing protein n=1 Tax=Xenopus tropicalis TaxID=8364 RepID=A0A803KC65_XENTR
TRLDALQVPQQLPQVFPDLPPSPPPAPSASVLLSEPKIPSPLRYGGDPETCRGFLNQCKIHFELFPHRYPNEKSKVAFIIALLFGKALAWASPLWERDDPLVNNAATFLSTFQQIFDAPGRKVNASARLLRITQGSRAASDYAIDFRTLAAETSWNNEALIAAFWHGLNDSLKDELAARDLPSLFEDLVSLVINIDTRLRERQLQRNRPRRFTPEFSTLAPATASVPASVPASVDEPMQLGATRLSVEERSRRRSAGLCMYCGSTGHFVKMCPNKPKQFLQQGNSSA